MAATLGAPAPDGTTEAEIVSVAEPTDFLTLIRAPNGRYLSADADGALTLSRWSTDGTAWREAIAPSASTFTHEVTGLKLTGSLASAVCEDAGEIRVEGANGRPFQLRQADGSAPLDETGKTDGWAASFTAQQGPAHLPSTYVAQMRETGWTCLPALVHPEALAVLRELRDVGNPFLQSSVLARVSVDPTVMYVLRQYLRSSAVQAGHIPSILTARPVGDEHYPGPQGWHSDYPYLWRTGGDQVPEPEESLPNGPDDVALGVQFNTCTYSGECIDAFSRHNGGTLFKLGSHRLNVGPPREWNAVPSGEALPGGRSSAGGGAVGKAMTPYAGPDCHTVECPAGSVILYDARTWHRMGENRSDGPRSCIPLATIPAFVMPFFDKSPVYIRFVTSRLYEELSERERDDLERMFVTKVAGEGVSADPELKDIKETGLRDNPKL